MKFLVTCLDDDFTTRVLASKSKVFNSVPEAIKYAGPIAHERVPSIIPVPSDAEHAAEFIFDHIVEKHPHFVTGSYDDLRDSIRYEHGGDRIMAVFAPGNDLASAFCKEDVLVFEGELKRLFEVAQ